LRVPVAIEQTRENGKAKVMGLYEVVLGIDRAARDTGRRIVMEIFGADPLAAAESAEALGDSALEDPKTMYCRAVSVVARNQTPGALAAAA
jgi:hypothetical protein